MPLTILYFAWVRERIGHADEIVTPPEHVRTMADLIGWLRDHGLDAAVAQVLAYRA